MEELAGAPSLDDAWGAFVAGDLDACSAHLSARLDALEPVLGAAATRLAPTWSAETTAVVDDAFLLGLLARKAGRVDLAMRAQRAVLLATWAHGDEAGTARWFQACATSELALAERNRNRGTRGLARLRALRHQLIDAELRGLLAEKEDVEEPALELVDHQIEYLENVLRIRGDEGIRPSYFDDEAPLDPDAAPPDPVRRSGDEPGAWPRPLEGVTPEPSIRDGLEQLGELNAETWHHVYAGREAAKAEHHEASLEAFDRAIQSAERVTASFRGAWDARRVLAFAVSGRSGALERLGLAGRSLEDASLATGILADVATAHPQVVELLTDESRAAATESWRRCQQGGTDDDVLERCQLAIALLDAARSTAVREPSDLLALMWATGHAARHYRHAHRYREFAGGLVRGQRVSRELVTNYYDHARRQSEEQLKDVRGPGGAVMRWLLRVIDRRVRTPAAAGE